MNVEIATYRLVEIDPADPANLDASFEIQGACRTHDRPYLPPVSRYHHDAVLRVPWPGATVANWLAYRDDRPVGVGSVSLPQRDNLNNAWCELEVHPDHRRRGAGRAIYQQIVGYAKAAGRTKVMGDALEPLPGGPPLPGSGAPFAHAVGMTAALREVRRRLDLSTADTEAYGPLLAEAWQRAGGYSLVQWRDRAPAEYHADIGYLDGRLVSDAPSGDLAWEPENIDAELVRQNEDVRIAHGDRCYSSAIRHDASGRLVGLTALIFDHSVTEHAWQQITLVDPDHRGHRLGTVVKIENLRYALGHEPGLRVIDTYNAAVNDHMIAINEAMGFRPVDGLVSWQQSISSG
jgi:RimJ/RimL family protein N-acetyltransferase